MRVALLSTFAASKKESLAEIISRIRQAFLDARLGEPTLRFTLTDTLRTKRVSAIDRVLKRHPGMAHFLTASPLLPGGSDVRRLSNAATGEAADYSTLQAIAAGVPRSYPFSSVILHFHAPAFGERLIGLPKLGNSLPGVWMTDNYLITGHQRALSVYTVVEAAETNPELPPNPEPVAAVIKTCGKIRQTTQVPIRAPGGGMVPSIPPANAGAVETVVAGYRARIREIVQLAGLPHSLPPASESRTENLGVPAGPRKPALVTAFKPLGYACRGGSGEFHLTRRSSGNLLVELYLDVGT